MHIFIVFLWKISWKYDIIYLGDITQNCTIGGMNMSKKSVIALTISLSATVLVLGTVAVGTILCKKIYKKNYFTADHINDM